MPNDRNYEIEENASMSEYAELAARLKRLEDEREISNLLIKYSLLVDRNELHRLSEEIFTDDAYLDFGIAHAKGRDQINAFFADNDGHLLGTAHTLANVYIEVDGDTAKSTSYVHAWHWHKQSGETKL